ncbi:cupin domain-containing protein [Halomonas sp. AOP13-D3-9]
MRVTSTYGVQTGGDFCLLDQLVTDQGGGPCTHAHPADEGMYIISGHCTYQAGGQQISAGPGSFVGIPRFAQHSFVVDAPGTQLLNFYLPAGFELFVMGFSLPAKVNALPPRRLVEQLSRDYGQIPILGLPAADPPSPSNMTTEALPEAAVQPFASSVHQAPAYWWNGGGMERVG